MISHLGRRWIAVVCLLAIPAVDLQVIYPMFPPPHVAMPVPVPIILREIPTTTTTTEAPMQVGFMSVPLPMPMPLAFPSLPAKTCNKKGCPPCPPCVCVPSCTPAFFSYCSPCHNKCRCRSTEDVPKPIPPPVPPGMGPPFGVAVPIPPMFGPPPPPPVVIMPLPPHPPLQIRRRPSSSECSESDTYSEMDSEDTDWTSSSTSRERFRWKKRGKRWFKEEWQKYGFNWKKHEHRWLRGRSRSRRQFDSVEVGGNRFIKPVLSYLNRDGEVKLKRRLTNDEADELMNDKPYQKVRSVVGEGNRPRVSVTSNIENNSGRKQNHRRKEVILSRAEAEYMLKEGKKELIFRPPKGKTISNLTVSFHVNE